LQASAAKRQAAFPVLDCVWPSTAVLEVLEDASSVQSHTHATETTLPEAVIAHPTATTCSNNGALWQCTTEDQVAKPLPSDVSLEMVHTVCHSDPEAPQSAVPFAADDSTVPFRIGLKHWDSNSEIHSQMVQYVAVGSHTACSEGPTSAAFPPSILCWAHEDGAPVWARVSSSPMISDHEAPQCLSDSDGDEDVASAGSSWLDISGAPDPDESPDETVAPRDAAGAAEGGTGPSPPTQVACYEAVAVNSSNQVRMSTGAGGGCRRGSNTIRLPIE
jgi:hypothetical protein